MEWGVPRVVGRVPVYGNMDQYIEVLDQYIRTRPVMRRGPANTMGPESIILV